MFPRSAMLSLSLIFMNATMICSGPKNMGKIALWLWNWTFPSLHCASKTYSFHFREGEHFSANWCSDRNIVFHRILYLFKHVFHKKQIFSSALGKHNKYQLTSQKPLTTWDLSICLTKLGCSAGKLDCISSALAIADSLFSSTLELFNKCIRVANFRYSLLTTM